MSAPACGVCGGPIPDHLRADAKYCCVKHANVGRKREQRRREAEATELAARAQAEADARAQRLNGGSESRFCICWIDDGDEAYGASVAATRDEVLAVDGLDGQSYGYDPRPAEWLRFATDVLASPITTPGLTELGEWKLRRFSDG